MTSKRRLLFLLLFLCAAPLGLLAGAAAAEDGGGAAAPSPLVVYCYDRGRDVVVRDLASHCRGAIVSAAEAAKIGAQRDLAIRRSLAVHPDPVPKGTRMVRIGTAFFIDADGRLVTNNHVVDACAAMIVETTGGDRLPAKVLAVDVMHDLALLQVAAKSPAVARFRTEAATPPGAFVAAVGYPDQGLPPREPIVTAGVLERPAESPTLGERLVIHANIEPGDSGSPLLEQHGLVIGVMNAKINTVSVYRRTGRVVSDVGLGIPLPAVLDFLKRNGVDYRSGAAGGTLDAAQLLAAARPYVARADCWK